MPQDLMDYHHGDTKLGGRPLSVMVAAGPYTTDDNLDFIPLDALISEARSTKPDTLILVSPLFGVCTELISCIDWAVYRFESPINTLRRYRLCSTTNLCSADIGSSIKSHGVISWDQHHPDT